MSDWKIYFYPLIFGLIFVAAIVLWLLVMLIARQRKRTHRMPVQKKKRSCPACGLNALVRTGTGGAGLITWYACNLCKVRFRRYRWRKTFRRIQDVLPEA